MQTVIKWSVPGISPLFLRRPAHVELESAVAQVVREAPAAEVQLHRPPRLTLRPERMRLKQPQAKPLQRVEVVAVEGVALLPEPPTRRRGLLRLH